MANYADYTSPIIIEILCWPKLNYVWKILQLTMAIQAIIESKHKSKFKDLEEKYGNEDRLWKKGQARQKPIYRFN